MVRRQNCAGRRGHHLHGQHPGQSRINRSRQGEKRMTEFEMKMKSAQKAVGLGKLSRRDFMQFAMASGMTLAAANTMFATAARAEPKKGGIFKVAIGHGQTTDSLDPATWSNGFTFHFGKSLYGRAAGAGRHQERRPAACGRKLRARRRRQEVDLQAAQGHHLPQRQDADRRRRGRHHQLSHRRRLKSPAKSVLSNRRPASRPTARRRWSSR